MEIFLCPDVLQAWSKEDSEYSLRLGTMLILNLFILIPVLIHKNFQAINQFFKLNQFSKHTRRLKSLEKKKKLAIIKCYKYK